MPGASCGLSPSLGVTDLPLLDVRFLFRTSSSSSFLVISYIFTGLFLSSSECSSPEAGQPLHLYTRSSSNW